MCVTQSLVNVWLALYVLHRIIHSTGSNMVVQYMYVFKSEYVRLHSNLLNFKAIKSFNYLLNLKIKKFHHLKQFVLTAEQG